MDLKQQAALHALESVQNGYRIGLGTGSTTRYFIQALGERWQEGAIRDILCVATSEETVSQSRSLGLPLASLSDLMVNGLPPVLDMAVDGADEVDADLNLIKGLGKAALREKMVEMHARRFIVIVDETKLVERLGRGPLPVEIVPFEGQITVEWLRSLGCQAELWCDEAGVPFVTDNQNWLVRCWFHGGILDPDGLARILNDRTGVVGHGLFLDMASEVIVATSIGLKVLKKRAN